MSATPRRWAAAVAVLLIAPVCATGGRGSLKKIRSSSSTDASSEKRCCSAITSGDAERPCRLIGPAAGCLGLSTRATCELAFTTGTVARGRELCAWLGGRCVPGSAADCAPSTPVNQVDYYGERTGFEASCGNGPSSTCPGLRAALERYAAAHDAATRDASPPGGLRAARLMVIRDHWKNVGMGFMPSHVATVVLFALTAGIYVYVENYGRYDWTRYFTGHAGLDLRWTPAKARMWRARWSSVGVARTHVEVWHEDGPRAGDEEWETTLAAHLSK